jgi:hypothetical protein
MLLVAIHWLKCLPPGSQTKDIGIQLIAAFLPMNYPLIFHQSLLSMVAKGVINKQKNYLVSFFVYALAKDGGVNGGELTRFQASCNLLLLHSKLLYNIQFLLVAIDLKRPSRVGYKELLAAVQKADGLGPLLASNFILVASYCGINEHVGWASHMKAGCPKTHEQLHKKFLGIPTQEKVNQLIRSSIPHQMLIGEHKAEKVVCLGLQKMSDKATCKDVVVPGSSIYSRVWCLGNGCFGLLHQNYSPVSAPTFWMQYPCLGYGRHQMSIIGCDHSGTYKL